MLIKKINRILLPLLFLTLIFSGCKDNSLSPPKSENSNTKTNFYKMEQAFPNIEGEELKIDLGNDKKITLVKKDTNYIFQGDIVLDEQKVSLLRNRAKTVKDTLPDTDATFLESLTTLWPNNTVYYTIQNNFIASSKVHDAISHWESSTNLSFIERTTQENYIEFISTEDGCYSTGLGMEGGQAGHKFRTSSFGR